MNIPVVVDFVTECILYHAPTPSVAFSVSLGLDPATSVNAELATPPSIDINTHYCMLRRTSDGSKFTVISLPKERINAALDEKIRLARIRGEAIYRLEIGLQRYLDRSDDFYDTKLDGYFVHCLIRSDPEKGDYAEGIREYAAISDISPYAAYHEMKLRVETFGMFRLRNYAHYRKYANVINKLNTQEEIDKQFAEWRDIHYYWTA